MLHVPERSEPSYREIQTVRRWEKKHVDGSEAKELGEHFVS